MTTVNGSASAGASPPDQPARRWRPGGGAGRRAPRGHLLRRTASGRPSSLRRLGRRPGGRLCRGAGAEAAASGGGLGPRVRDHADLLRAGLRQRPDLAGPDHRLLHRHHPRSPGWPPSSRRWPGSPSSRGWTTCSGTGRRHRRPAWPRWPPGCWWCWAPVRPCASGGSGRPRPPGSGRRKRAGRPARNGCAWPANCTIPWATTCL